MLEEETKRDRTVSGKGGPTAHDSEKELCHQSGNTGKPGRCSAESGVDKYSWAYYSYETGSQEVSKRGEDMKVEACHVETR